MTRKIYFLFIGILISFNSYSKVVVWSIPPEYDELKPYSEGLYYCKNGDKWGLVNTSGKIILTTKYDFITPMVDGYTIAGVKEGSKNKIVSILTNSYESIDLKTSYYLVNKYYTFFSEGKLPVSNKSGKQGFINTDGDLVVKCQFDNVHPFSNGFASVSKYPMAYYITDKYDYNPRNNMLPVDFNYGDITFASTFYNGKAVVAYNQKSAVINASGHKIGNYKGNINSNCYNKFDYTIKDCGSVMRSNEYRIDTNPSISSYQENGLYGYRQNNQILVYPTFNSAEPFLISDNATVSLNGKFGLIHVVDGEVSSYLAKSNGTSKIDNQLKVSANGNIENCDYVITLPPSLNISDISVSIDKGTGEFKNYQMLDNNGLGRVLLKPEVINPKAKSLKIMAEVRYKGILVHKFDHTLNLSYPIIPEAQPTPQKQAGAVVMSEPKVQTERADKFDIQVVEAVISNTTHENINITATLSVPSKGKTMTKKLHIAPSGSIRIALSIPNVIKREIVTATISLSSGRTKSSQVILNGYY